MVCDKKTNLEKGWNRYCTGLRAFGFRNDTIFGVYIGCSCKKHDIHYSNEGIGSRKAADKILRLNVRKDFKKKNRSSQGLIVSNIIFALVRVVGPVFWKNWSSKGVKRYKEE